MRRDIRGMTTAMLVLALTGCIFSFQRPTLRVAEVRLKALGVSGGTVGVQLEIANPNGYDLRSTAFGYKLDFSGGNGTNGDADWITLAEGRHDQPILVPANDSASVEIDVPFDLAAVSGALGSLLRRGEVNYRFSGELQVMEPRRTQVPFNLRGVFRP